MLNDIEEIRFTARSEDNLRGVHPDLVRVIRLALRYSLVPFSVSEGLRSMARQREMVRAGSSQTLRSRHPDRPRGGRGGDAGGRGLLGVGLLRADRGGGAARGA